ncbi:hypothetical protein [Moorella sp. Hama-1]|uniref:hypothetical protein n=1 Tax=Moorella sp. Hama-1 TaxID=2138101 RepID=UPI000D648F36|nr:hypothetical protein [Moorella sp. Hama-1]MDN5361283.1 hypothetical protein [Moorella sp. (in: firmicutes)]BCV21269.1 hypothetical protein hamaS1_13380 [Moorella sp. Hama-1]
MRSQRLENEILQRIDELVQCAISSSLKDEVTREAQLKRGASLVQAMGDLLLEVLEGREEHLQALLEQLIAQRLPDRRILQSFGNFPRDIQQMISNGIASYLASRQEEKDEPAGAATATPGEGAPGDNSAPVAKPVNEETDSSPFGEEVPVAALEEEAEEPEETVALETTTAPVAEQEPTPTPKPTIAEASPAIDDTLPGGEATIVDGTSNQEATQEDNAGVLDDAVEALYLALLQAYPGEEIIRDYETRGGKITFYLPQRQLGFELATWRHDWRHDFYCRQEGISIRQVADDELTNPAYLARRLRREAAWRQSS